MQEDSCGDLNCKLPVLSHFLTTAIAGELLPNCGRVIAKICSLFSPNI